VKGAVIKLAPSETTPLFTQVGRCEPATPEARTRGTPSDGRAADLHG